MLPSLFLIMMKNEWTNLRLACKVVESKSFTLDLLMSISS